MLKHLVGISLVVLLVTVLVQQQALQKTQNQLEDARLQVRELELASAGAKGTLAGLYLVTSKDKNRLFKLQRLVATKDHQITSLQRGHLLTITAYNAEASQTWGDPFITASNSKVRPGIVAVSQDLFRNGWVFGRKVYIVGHGVYTIEDLLAKRKSKQLDIFMTSKKDAIEFGRKKLRVYLLGS